MRLFICRDFSVSYRRKGIEPIYSVKNQPMIGENLIAFFLLYVRPVTAVGRILDRGRLWFAIAVALAVSLAQHAFDVPFKIEATDLEIAALRFISYFPHGYLAPLLAVAIAFVPALILLRSLTGHGSFSTLMQSNYAQMAMTALTVWAVAYLPIALLPMFKIDYGPIPHMIASAYFTILMAVVVRSVFGTGWFLSIGMAAVGWCVSVGACALSGVAGHLSGYFLSPFVLYYLYYMFNSDVRGLGDALRSRQHFRQQLEIATNNPHDADAHYQLGLIHQKRHQYSEAVSRYRRATEIDPREADPHFQLGRIARLQKRLDEALQELKLAVSLDEKLSQGDVVRELGAAYFESGKIEEAAAALEKFVNRREYDPEGLYWYGRTLAQLGRKAEAKEMFQRAIEAVKTMPSHRRAETRVWGSQSKSELRKLV